MKRAPANLHTLVRQLLEQEAEAGDPSSVVLAEAAERACRKLRQRLVMLIGPTGFEALMARALDLAKREESASLGAQVPEVRDDCLRGQADAIRGPRPDAAAQRLVAMLVNFLWLLTTFIGEDLVRHVVHEVWPDLPPSDTRVGTDEAT